MFQRLLLILCLFSVVPAIAQPVRQMADFNTGSNDAPQGGLGGEAKFVDGRTIFVGTDRIHGTELWVTDGTAPNTRLLADICPGQCSSNPANLHPEGNTLYFGADDGVHGRELWRLPSGTDVPTLLADINPGLDGSDPGEFIRRAFLIGGSSVTRTYFAATRRAEGRELWRLSANVPTLERDIAPGAVSSDPRTITILANGAVGVTAQTPNLGRELYVIGYNTSADPAAVSATPIGGFGISTQRSLTTEVVTVGSKTYAVVDDRTTFDRELYVTDGTTAGTLRLRTADSISGLAANVALARLFYQVRQGSIDTLGISDGTVAGSINLASTDLTPLQLTMLGNRVFFTGLTPSNGRELFASDGTVAGTGLFKELVPGAAGIPDNAIGRISTNNLRAFFGYTTDVWVTDGTSANTLELTGSVVSGTTGRITRLLPTTGTNVLFGFDPVGSSVGEPFFTGGTVGSTVSLGQMIPDVGDSFPTPVGVIGQRLIAGATAPGANTNTFSLSTTTAAPPVPLQSTSLSIGGIRFGRLWMRSAAGLKATDGTDAGTTVLTPARPEMFLPDCVVMRNGIAHVLAIDGNDVTTQIFGSDGTVTGTTRATNVPAESGIGIRDFCIPGFRGIAGFGDSIFVVGRLPGPVDAGFELLRLDADNQLAMVIDLRPGATSSAIEDMVALPDRLLFVANDGIFGLELWATTGTAQGTVRLTDVNPGAGSSEVRNLTRVGNRVYFTATSPTHGTEWFVTDGTPAGTTRITDLFAGSGSGTNGSTVQVASIGDTLFFTGTSSTETGCRLFRTQGTQATTRCAYDRTLESLGPIRDLAATAGGALVFPATRTASNDGEELRVLANGQLVDVPGLDVRQGQVGSAPSDLFVSGDDVYFRANDGATGFELWQLTVPDVNRVFGNGFE